MEWPAVSRDDTFDAVIKLLFTVELLVLPLPFGGLGRWHLLAGGVLVGFWAVILVGRLQRRRQRGRVLTAAAMSIGGSLALWPAFFLIVAVVGLWAENLLLGRRIPEFVGGLTGYAAAGWWAGWRLGRWGWASGLAGGLASTAVILGPGVPAERRWLLFVAAGVLLAGLMGHLGAWRAHCRRVAGPPGGPDGTAA